ncbi:MAG: hypothetical protein QOJ98_2611 [Acidobacteriota bacterium]|jgi:hypothetical protein|nr:hypothetical protein [Acidobacteriota bacterium]
MRLRTLGILCAILALATACKSARPSVTPPTAPSQLDVMIRLTEARENGEIIPTTFGTTPRMVDINSNIVIDVSAPPLGTALASSQLVAISQQFRASAVTMPDTIRRAHTVASRRQANALSQQEFVREQEDLRATFSAFANNALNYVNALRGSTDPVASARAEAFEQKADDIISGATRPVDQTATNLQNLLVQEADWLTDRLMQEAQSVASQPPTRALILAAASADKPDVFLALPEYNNIPPGVPVTFDKLQHLRSPGAVAALQASFAEAKAVAQLGNELRSGTTDFRTAANGILKASGFDVQALATNFQAVVTDVQSLSPADLTNAAQAIASSIPASPSAGDTTTVNSIRQLSSTLTTNVSLFNATRASLQQQLANLSPRLVSAQLQQQAADPVAALMTIVSQIDAAQGLVNDGLNDLVNLAGQARSTLTAVQSVGTALTRLTTQVQTLTDATVKQSLTSALQSVPATSKLATDLMGLQTTVDATINAINAIRARLKPSEVAFASTPPSSSTVVGFDALKDSYLDLRSTLPDRQPGDVVALQAWIYEVTPGPNNTFTLGQVVDSRTQQFEMTRFGFYADASAGVTFVHSEFTPAGESEPTQQFAPQVSLLGHYRPWPKGEEAANRRPPWYTGLALGLHTISVDLNKDNQLELGLGVTASLGSWLQIGYGADLTLDEGRYVFVGTQLFRFLTSLGIKAPAAK